MNEHTKGELTFRGKTGEGDALIDIDGEYFARIVFPMKKDKKNVEANAKELVRRWNAFDSTSQSKPPVEGKTDNPDPSPEQVNANLLTVSQIAEELGEPPQRVTYIIRKYRLKPVQRIGIIRLFDDRQVEVIKQGLYGIQIRSSR